MTAAVRPPADKVPLPHSGAEILDTIQSEWAFQDPFRWKLLACFTLYEVCGWQLERIGLLFGHPKGHVSRLVKQARRELRDRFAPPTPPDATDIPADSEV